MSPVPNVAKTKTHKGRIARLDFFVARRRRLSPPEQLPVAMCRLLIPVFLYYTLHKNQYAAAKKSAKFFFSQDQLPLYMDVQRQANILFFI